MRDYLRSAAWAVAGVALLGLASCNKTSTTTTTETPAAEATAPAETMAPAAPVVDAAAEQQAITALSQSWGALITTKDAASAAALYADDGGIYPPGMPAQMGHDALVTTWTGFMNIPGMALETHINNITVASAGDMAIETGTYTQKSGDAAAPAVENGKYVTTWVKRDGQWKILTDMFNADGPAGAAPADSTMTAPATPAPATPAPSAQ